MWGNLNFCIGRVSVLYYAAAANSFTSLPLIPPSLSLIAPPRRYSCFVHAVRGVVTLQSTMLVPYFSWQRSHAMYHAYTNHMENGETHVPELVTHEGFGLQKQRKIFRTVLGNKLGTSAYGAYSALNRLVVSQDVPGPPETPETPPSHARDIYRRRGEFSLLFVVELVVDLR